MFYQASLMPKVAVNVTMANELRMLALNFLSQLTPLLVLLIRLSTCCVKEPLAAWPASH